MQFKEWFLHVNRNKNRLIDELKNNLIIKLEQAYNC